MRVNRINEPPKNRHIAIITTKQTQIVLIKTKKESAYSGHVNSVDSVRRAKFIDRHFCWLNVGIFLLQPLYSYLPRYDTSFRIFRFHGDVSLADQWTSIQCFITFLLLIELSDAIFYYYSNNCCEMLSYKYFSHKQFLSMDNFFSIPTIEFE